MTDKEPVDLRAQAASGDLDAVAQLVELAGERGDLDELRRLAAAGSSDAVDILVELAGEREDLGELRRLAAAGSRDAADVLAELTAVEDEDTSQLTLDRDIPDRASGGGQTSAPGRADAADRIGEVEPV